MNFKINNRIKFAILVGNFATSIVFSLCYLSWATIFAPHSSETPFFSLSLYFPFRLPMPLLDRGDVWKSKARSLQLQFRDRFRVAVDHHWRRRHHHTFIPSADGYFSSTIQRCLSRFRDFRRDSLPSSTSFYRKRGTQLITLIIYSVNSDIIILWSNEIHDRHYWLGFSFHLTIFCLYIYSD